MSKKSFDRIESKKKKAAAFIQLVKTDENYMKTKLEKPDMPDQGSTSDTQNSVKQSSSTGGEKSLADEMFAEYKKMMRERQKAAMMKPKVFLTLDELIRDDPVQTEVGEVKVPPPLFMADVQHLLLYALQGKDASIKPRWCRLLRVGKVCKVVAVVLDSLSSEEFKKYPESLPTLAQAFDMHVEMISPLQYGSSAREDIMNVPISITQLKKKGLLEKKKTFKNDEKKIPKNPDSNESIQAWDLAKAVNSLAENPLEFFDSETPGQKRKRSNDETDVDNKRLKTEDCGIVYKSESTYEMDNYDRRWLMLNAAQMICEGIPTPVNTGNNRYKSFVFSKREYKQVTEKSPLFAVDCEMVQTKASSMDLARVSFVDENLQVVYDTLVKPWAPVTNYVTQFSGITKKILDPVRTRIQDVQRVIQAFLPPDAILCGQSICSDLSSMKIFHPYIIDTSVIYNLTGNRNMKAGLKRLSSIFLRKGIQEGSGGHSSVEDAQATMELVLLKLRNNIEFGDISMLEPDLSNSVSDSVAESPITSDNVDDDKAELVEMITDKPSENTEVTNDNSNSKCEESTDTNKKLNDTDTDKKLKDITVETVQEDKDMNESGNSTTDSGECSNLTKTITTPSENKSDTWKRRLFFQNEGSKFIENFIIRIRNNRLQRRDGAIIDEPSSLDLYPKDLPIITCMKDKESEKQTIDKIRDVGFCFTHLYGFKNYLKEKRKLDQSEISNLNGKQEPDKSQSPKTIRNEGNDQSESSQLSDDQSDASNSKERSADQSDDEEEIKSCLWKLDRRFWKILMGLPSNSLFVVILPGREENGKIQPAMTFAKIT
ncbi:uncharacterized protein LOC132758972 [Ruditapes philippinarum]|uniref:uncharacterized protein LOC132758972 n=1 Tax=Ruditapes philippinarum TaxID=129788 RepID=UPI00295B90F4|nr:uncharacterized protein LOC132758972 [Ruditapes philippinarum]